MGYYQLRAGCGWTNSWSAHHYCRPTYSLCSCMVEWRKKWRFCRAQGGTCLGCVWLQLIVASAASSIIIDTTPTVAEVDNIEREKNIHWPHPRVLHNRPERGQGCFLTDKRLWCWKEYVSCRQGIRVCWGIPGYINAARSMTNTCPFEKDNNSNLITVSVSDSFLVRFECWYSRVGMEGGVRELDRIVKCGSERRDQISRETVC